MYSLANPVDVCLVVAGLDLQGARDRLPSVRVALGHPQDGDVHGGQGDGAPLPRVHVLLGRPVRTLVAAAEQLRGPGVEVGAVAQAFAPELARLVHWTGNETRVY